MTIKDQEHYNPEEPKPVWRETKGFKYQIYEDHIRIIFEDKEIPISFLSLKHIQDNIYQNEKDGYYCGQCIECHKFDALVKGYCKVCFDKNDMQYDGDTK